MLPGFGGCSLDSGSGSNAPQSNHGCNDFGSKEKMEEEREDGKGMRERRGGELREKGWEGREGAKRRK